jgi:antitoxin MazE
MDLNQGKGVVSVTTKVQKWGNSLGIRIPSVIADQVELEQGSEVEMVVENRAIKLIPKKKKPTLAELLAKITPENRHAEIDFGIEGNELL